MKFARAQFECSHCHIYSRFSCTTFNIRKMHFRWYSVSIDDGSVSPNEHFHRLGDLLKHSKVFSYGGKDPRIWNYNPFMSWISSLNRPPSSIMSPQSLSLGFFGIIKVYYLIRSFSFEVVLNVDTP